MRERLLNKNNPFLDVNNSAFQTTKKKQYAHAEKYKQRSLSGLPPGTITTPEPPATTTPPPTTPPPTTPPPLALTPWLPQCTSVVGGTGYTVLAQPASAASNPSNVNTEFTGQEYIAATGFDAATLTPMPLPVVNDGNAVAASVCPSNAEYLAGPTASRTTCYLVSCFATGCFTCSGTFVADPTAGQDRLLFLTATHCVARSLDNTIVLSKSFVSCDRDEGISTASKGVFQPVAVTMSKIDFGLGYGLKDGSLIQMLALADTNVAYAQPVAVGAVTLSGLSQSVPNFSAGFPQIGTQFEGCTAANLGNQLAIHYSRVISTRALTGSGIQIPRLSACGGNSGGTMLDEQACVLFGVLSASSVSCVDGKSSNYYSRIVADGDVEGVPFLTLAQNLVSGQVKFVN